MTNCRSEQKAKELVRAHSEIVEPKNTLKLQKHSSLGLPVDQLLSHLEAVKEFKSKKYRSKKQTFFQGVYQIQDRNQNTLEFRLFKDSDLGFDDYANESDPSQSDYSCSSEEQTEAQDQDVESDDEMIDNFVDSGVEGIQETAAKMVAIMKKRIRAKNRRNQKAVKGSLSTTGTNCESSEAKGEKVRKNGKGKLKI